MTETAEHAPRRVKAAILRRLAESKHPRTEVPDLAHRFNMTADDVKAIATAHGGIEQPQRLARAAEALESGSAGERPAALPGPRMVVDATAELLKQAAASKSKVTVKMGARLEGMIGDLKTRLDAEDEKRRAQAAEQARRAEERRRAEQEKKRAREEVERLEQQLRDAKAKLRGGKKPAKTTAVIDGGPTAKTIRAWARDNGIDCPATGRVPATVRDQYAAAHTEEATSA